MPTPPIHRDREGVARTRRAHVPNKAAPPLRVLVVDDDDDVRWALEATLREDGFATAGAANGAAALVEARRALPDVVLTDLQMPLMNGTALCQRLHEIDRDLPVIVMTGFADMRSVVSSLAVGADDYLIKPLQYEAVLWCVRRAIARRAAKRESEELYRTLNERLVLSSVREQELAEAEAEQRAQLAALLENLSDGVVIAEAGGRVRMINAAARAILGLGERDLDTIATLDAVPACDLEGNPLAEEQRPVVRALRGEQFTDYEIVRVRATGERQRLASTGTSVQGADGRVELAIVVFRDVTALRRLEQQRDEYLGLISHDLRTPLSSILIFVTTLKRMMAKERISADPNVADLTERAVRSVSRMDVMLKELIEATSLESQGVALHREVHDLYEIVAGVIATLDDARAKRITVDADGAYAIFVDAPRLERVVVNLLTNALKYSAEDTPVIVRLTRDERGVALEVIDRGIGIAPESVEMLFDRYYRTRAGKARAEGLGLGLYIARLIVEAHGGRIEVASEVGKGSAFKLMLPSNPDAR